MQAIVNTETITALLIEDNPDDREFFARHIERVKYKHVQLECCELLSDGLTRLAKGGVDIIFLDLSLPDSFGLQTLQKVHKLAPKVPIVVLTGTDDDDLASRALSIGAQDYLVKGQLDPSSLGRSINYAIVRQKSFAALQWTEAVVQGSTDAIIGKSMENIVLSWNKGAEHMLGYQASEIIGKPMDILILPGLQNDLDRNFELIKRNEKVTPFETTWRRKDGTEIIVYISASPIYDDSGSVSGVSVIARDITKQRQTELALKETDERLSLSVTASKIGLWDWDIDTDKIRWDSRMFDLFGVNSQHFTPSNDSLIESIYPDDRPRITETVQRALSTGGAFNFSFRVVMPDATIRFIETKGEVFCDMQRKPLRMTGACFDITDRTLADNALKDNEKRLRLALDSAKMGVWDWDLESNQVWRSPRHDEIFGYDSMLPEWTYEMFLKHVLPEDLAAVQEKIELSLINGNYTLECRIIHASDNSVHWISSQAEAYKDEHGKVIRILGTITDITEAKHLEQAARRTRTRREQISQAIVQHAPIGIAILDNDLEITNINAAFASLMHCEQERLLCQPLKDFLPKQVVPFAQEFIKSGKQVHASKLLVAIQNNGSLIQNYWDLSLWPVSNEQGQMIEAVLMIIDRSHTVLLEQQRDDFVASVAHDIKNPLIGAERVFDTLCNQTVDTSPEIRARMLSLLREGNQNLLSLVQNLVDVYRFETLAYPCHFEVTDLTSIIGSCINQMAGFSQSHDVTIKSDSADSLSIQADAIAIRRVIMNLLHNAVKFNKQGGTVEVTLSRIDDDVQMRVIDSGGGIGDSDQQRLFQRFSQAAAGKRYTNGTGLGLYLSKQIIEAHHGKIVCESKLGVGTTFVITLPITQVSHDHQNTNC